MRCPDMPSGANQQPWRFVAVQDPAVRRALREASEEVEREFYQHRRRRNG